MIFIYVCFTSFAFLSLSMTMILAFRLYMSDDARTRSFSVFQVDVTTGKYSYQTTTRKVHHWDTRFSTTSRYVFLWLRVGKGKGFIYRGLSMRLFFITGTFLHFKYVPKIYSQRDRSFNHESPTSGSLYVTNLSRLYINYKSAKNTNNKLARVHKSKQSSTITNKAIIIDDATV